MNLPKRVTIREVGPRDGLQMEPEFISTELKVEMINRLAATGIPRIEATSFVHPRAIPQMANAAEVMAQIERRPGTKYEVLVPNGKGAQRAVAAGVDGMLLVIAASDVLNRANVNMTTKESIDAATEVFDVAKAANIPVTVGIATATGCPYTGDVPPDRVMMVAEAAARLGAAEICLADTIGCGFPAQLANLATAVMERWPQVPVMVHLHDTRGLALANVIACMHAGVTTYDTSIGGLGGCPFSPGATGNGTTEDLVHMLHGMGIETGVDLDALL
ncbi:MAG: hydroxymethylglutaryl-CoA lyase, partial [Chloroflexi bacterium]|nr:hydroxymethylglutaryl-CoA lyase [Chloroflexota bacterium]